MAADNALPVLVLDDGALCGGKSLNGDVCLWYRARSVARQIEGEHFRRQVTQWNVRFGDFSEIPG